MKNILSDILEGKTSLGIEFGSTRVKAIMVDSNNSVIEDSSFTWENEFNSGVWTYKLEDAWNAFKTCIDELKVKIKKKYVIELNRIGAIGVSGMMHGYIALDKDDNLLTPFRTWRNTITGEASGELTSQFNFAIPQRWSIAHLYQAILNGEEHVQKISYLTTLAGYIHYKLTGEKVMGIGEASGMFPIDPLTKDYNKSMVEKFDKLVETKNYSWSLLDILPKVLVAGENAGSLTEEGLKLIDPDCELSVGIPLCPPEGDAGTGMIATNSIAANTGNVSAGTSAFAMVVLENELSKMYHDLDIVTTPDGKTVAMAHSNNCTSDINGWVSLMHQAMSLMGHKTDLVDLYEPLYKSALDGDVDCGGLLTYGYVSGEHITGFESGIPLFLREQNSNFTIGNFMRSHLNTAMGAMRIGLDNLFVGEGVKLSKLLGHGGFFKTEGVGQRIMAAALNTPVSVMETSGEGGAWGIALLASYLNSSKQLEVFLNEDVFNEAKEVVVEPIAEEVEGFNVYLEKYKKGFAVERAAVDNFKGE